MDSICLPCYADIAVAIAAIKWQSSSTQTIPKGLRMIECGNECRAKKKVLYYHIITHICAVYFANVLQYCVISVRRKCVGTFADNIRTDNVYSTHNAHASLGSDATFITMATMHGMEESLMRYPS